MTCVWRLTPLRSCVPSFFTVIVTLIGVVERSSVTVMRIGDCWLRYFAASERKAANELPVRTPFMKQVGMPETPYQS